MAKNILICNQKGGVGKSMVADELVFSFERSKIPVSFLDLDGQGGTIHATNQRDDAKVVVIDTPGVIQKQLPDWLRGSDVIIVPTRTTSRDIEPLQRMQRAIQASARAETPVVYVLNGWNRWRASRDFLEWFRSTSGNAVILKIPQSEQIVQAGAAGMSVVKYSRRGAVVKAVLELCNTVRRLSGFPLEE